MDHSLVYNGVRLRRRRDIARVANTIDSCNIAEIGTYKGAFAESLLQGTVHAHLHCIDPWGGWKGRSCVDPAGDAMHDSVRHLLHPFESRVMIIRQESVKASEIFTNEYFNIVYIDGLHNWPFVHEDLIAWWPKVRSGGLFCGHDFHDRRNFDVRQAVTDFCAFRRLDWYRTPKDVCKSWFVVKP